MAHGVCGSTAIHDLFDPSVLPGSPAQLVVSPRLWRPEREGNTGLHPDGTAWVARWSWALSPDPHRYWRDLARATDVLAQLARRYRVPRLGLYGDNPHRVTDPLWHRGWAVLDVHRAGC